MRKGICLFLLFLLTACSASTPSVEYYTLSSMESESRLAETGDNSSRIIGVGPVIIPEYLETTRIVTRSSPNKLTLNEYHRWAGSLKDELLRTLSENLAILTGSRQVITYPWKGSVSPEIRIEIMLKQFEAIPGEKAVLKATWMVSGNDQKSSITIHQTVIEESISTSEIETIVAAESRLVARLCKAVAAGLN